MELVAFLGFMEAICLGFYYISGGRTDPLDQIMSNNKRLRFTFRDQHLAHQVGTHTSMARGSRDLLTLGKSGGSGGI